MIAALSPPPLFVVLGIAYLVAGVGTATLLSRTNPKVAASALLAWPVLLPLVFAESAAENASTGPRCRGSYADRIDRTLDAISATLRETGELPDDLRGLRDELYAADARISLADRVLSEENGTGADLEALRAARARSAEEIEAVLSGVVQLRVQVGVLALAGNAAPVRDRLRELRGRISALDEVSRV